MPYARDLSAFSLDDLRETLTTVELLPSRRSLADNIDDVVNRLQAMGVTDVEALRLLLASRKRYGEIATALGVDPDYVTLLNREVNSYKTKPLPLHKLGLLTEAELERLAELGFRSTKDLYDGLASRAVRGEIADASGIDVDRIDAALQLSDLVRINGVGPAFAHFLRDLGLGGPQDVLACDSREIVDLYNTSVAEQPGQPKLRQDDIEYCKRFSTGLDDDIEW